MANIIQYPHAFAKSQKVLSLLSSPHFPLNLANICAELDILLFTKDEYLNYRIATKQTLPEIPIADGRSYLTYRNNKKIYTIIYDNKPYWRNRFTIAHELGHILLGHLNDERLEMDRGGIDSALYQEFENEADVFASNFLAPPILMHEKLNSYSFRYTESAISNTFHISTQAVAYHRMEDYRLWKTQQPTEVELYLLEQCRKDMHYHRCNNCKTTSDVPNAVYCQVCGTSGNFNRFRGSEEMKYTGIEMDDNNKPLKCPRCDNEQLPSEGDYCQICGLLFYNNCLCYDPENNGPCDNGYHLEGSARYCPYCGAQTTYMKQGILKPYTEEESNPNDDDYPFD